MVTALLIKNTIASAAATVTLWIPLVKRRKSIGMTLVNPEYTPIVTFNEIYLLERVTVILFVSPDYIITHNLVYFTSRNFGG